jgi:hypothetical protein
LSRHFVVPVPLTLSELPVIKVIILINMNVSKSFNLESDVGFDKCEDEIGWSILFSTDATRVKSFFEFYIIVLPYCPIEMLVILINTKSSKSINLGSNDAIDKCEDDNLNKSDGRSELTDLN